MVLRNKSGLQPSGTREYISCSASAFQQPYVMLQKIQYNPKFIIPRSLLISPVKKKINVKPCRKIINVQQSCVCTGPHLTFKVHDCGDKRDYCVSDLCVLTKIMYFGHFSCTHVMFKVHDFFSEIWTKIHIYTSPHKSSDRNNLLRKRKDK